MLFGDARQSTPVETAEAVAQMLAMEQKMQRTSTTLGGNEEEENLNVVRETSLSPATKKESQMKVLKSHRNSIYRGAKKTSPRKSYPKISPART